VSRILLLAPDEPPAPNVLAAGPGIRSFELARVLRDAGCDVTLAAPAPNGAVVWDPDTVDRLAAGHDAVVVPQGHAELGRQIARRLPPDLPVVVDCYAPGLIENLSLSADPMAFPGFLERSLELLRRGDLFLVANERQRLYTLGLLSALGRLNPATYADPPILEVPFGVPESPPPRPTSRVARGILVPEDAPLAIWYGGVYPWFDAATAVAAFHQALTTLPDAWFVIVGGRHPRAHAPDRELVRALDAAAALGISERVLEASWSPYEERVAWYAESDCAICLHHAGIESELAQRTRLVDLLWGRVPFVCSNGDAVGDRAVRAGAAIGVPVGDAGAAGAALISLLADADRRERLRAAAAALSAEHAWPRVLAPLVEWLAAPRSANDRIAGATWREAFGALLRAAVAARR
jgi:glycosyltransferase involved in cell wall biosynthesis